VRALGFLCLAGWCLDGCASARVEPPRVAAHTERTAGRVTEAVQRPPSSRGPRVLIYHDMEGLSGQDDWRTWSFLFPEQYRVGQDLLAADVNAVVDGLFAGGASSVEVVDAHGSGNPDPDLRADKLDPRAKQVFRDKPFKQYVDLVAPDTYDAIVALAMHARTGGGGFSSHTIAFGTDVIMNGMSITETELIGYSWGRAGVPVILASGDDKLRDALRDVMPWVEYVQVKRAKSASEVELRPVEEARAALRAGAKRALERLDSMKVMRLTTPVHAAVHATAPAGLGALEGVPGVHFADNTVDFVAPDFRAAYDGVQALIGVAERPYTNMLVEMVAQRPDGMPMIIKWAEALTNRWLDVESGRWTPPPESPPPPGTRYFGAR
jgi:D-amino peptidase